MTPSRALAYAQTHRRRFLEELKQFIRFPSVSAQPKHARDLKRCAEWLAAHLRRIGLARGEVITTRGQPIVYAEWKGRTDAPTVLIYGHYDVQPPEPLKEWHSAPFAAEVRGDNLYGRGACDDKGQMFAHVKALEAHLATARALPVNVKCIFEGGEEIGSGNLIPFIERNRRALAVDAAVVSDAPMMGPGQPAITYAMRGGLSAELEVHGPEHDLHSGLYGGAVLNPRQALCEIISRLHDARGHVTIPGFYDRVLDWSGEERQRMAESGPSARRILHDARTAKDWGEPGFTPYERITLRPALTVNGITGGYQGAGSKGVIPGRALAKLNFRLAPDQDPHEVDHAFRSYIKRITPAEVKSEVRTSAHARPVVLNPRHPMIRAAAVACRRGFGRAPVFLRSGGTVPVVNTFQQILGVPTVLMGFALPDDHMHAPNEKFHLPNFFRGIATCVWFLQAAGAARRKERAAAMAGGAG
jgi:acetylornithine deacetylase/succinyl-diaminopimelate desuccinylase-like protein